MSTRSKPKKGASPKRSRAPSTRLTPAELEQLSRLEAKGIVRYSPGFGRQPFPPELLKPGPACPGAVDALIAERRAGR